MFAFGFRLEIHNFGVGLFKIGFSLIFSELVFCSCRIKVYTYTDNKLQKETIPLNLFVDWFACFWASINGFLISVNGLIAYCGLEIPEILTLFECETISRGTTYTSNLFLMSEEAGACVFLDTRLGVNTSALGSKSKMSEVHLNGFWDGTLFELKVSREDILCGITIDFDFDLRLHLGMKIST